jgi:hypothetical protein
MNPQQTGDEMSQPITATIESTTANRLQAALAAKNGLRLVAP